MLSPPNPPVGGKGHKMAEANKLFAHFAW
jgi:hypothetical protein